MRKISLESLLKVKEEWHNLGSSVRDNYSVLIVVVEGTNPYRGVHLVKNDKGVKYLEENNYKLERKITYEYLLRLIDYKEKWEDKIGG